MRKRHEHTIRPIVVAVETRSHQASAGPGCLSRRDSSRDHGVSRGTLAAYVQENDNARHSGSAFRKATGSLNPPTEAKTCSSILPRLRPPAFAS
jgi:hypothetical protein